MNPGLELSCKFAPNDQMTEKHKYVITALFGKGKLAADFFKSKPLELKNVSSKFRQLATRLLSTEATISLHFFLMNGNIALNI
jgi:hypothetical protein